MSTVIENTTTETEVIETTPVREQWSGEFVKHEVSERAREIAAKLQPLVKTTNKGVSLDNKAYYAAASVYGLSEETLNEVDNFQGAYAEAAHSLFSDLALKHFKEKEDNKEFVVSAKMGKSSTYGDVYKREYSRTIRNPQTGESSVREYHGYHNASIETEYKNMKTQRTSVMELAKDLLG